MKDQKEESVLPHDTTINVITVPNTLIATLTDILCLPMAAVSVFYSYFVVNQDPDQAKISHPAILLLHGSSGNHGTMSFGVYRLMKHFPKSVFTVQYDGVWRTDPKKGIDDYLPTITAKCLEIQEKTQQNQIYMVGHSLGGLLAARFVQKEAYKYNISVPAIVTIGSPWRGSELINKIWSTGKAKQRHEDMRPKSKFLTELNQELISTTKYYCVGSVNDLLVPYKQSVPENRSLEHLDNLCLSSVGHYTLVVYPVVWDFVEDILLKHIT